MSDLAPAQRGWLDAIARDGWLGATAEAAAELAGMTRAELLAGSGDRIDALHAFAAALDVATRAAVPDAGSVRDRLFDALMARFDRLQQDRPVGLALLAARDPAVPLVMGRALAASLRRLADAAGVDLSPPLRLAKVAALTVIHARALQAWRRDDTPDMTAVMACLDQDLARAEDWAHGRGTLFGLPLGRFVSRGPAPPPSPGLPTE